MKDDFVDHNLKINSSLYENVCVPLRLILGMLFISGIVHPRLIPIFGVLMVITAFGLYRKMQISGNSWKCYTRAILAYSVIAALIFTHYVIHPVHNIDTVIGLILIFDVLMGIQSKHVFEKLG